MQVVPHRKKQVTRPKQPKAGRDCAPKPLQIVKRNNSNSTASSVELCHRTSAESARSDNSMDSTPERDQPLTVPKRRDNGSGQAAASRSTDSYAGTPFLNGPVLLPHHVRGTPCQSTGVALKFLL